jgi:hypothetical protein
MRHDRAPHGVLLSAAIVLLLQAAPALSARGPALAWPGSEVAGGQLVELSWGELPAGTEELEILLSLDDGRTYTVRVSPELDARERRYRWRVPGLHAAHARLRLRLGSERAELEAEPTAPFRIVGAPAGSPPEPLFHEGTSWGGLVPPGSGRPVADAFAPVTRLTIGNLGHAVAKAPRRSILRPPAPDRVAADPVTPRSGPFLSPQRPIGGPEFFPQRN